MLMIEGKGDKGGNGVWVRVKWNRKERSRIQCDTWSVLKWRVLQDFQSRCDKKSVSGLLMGYNGFKLLSRFHKIFSKN